jgi:lipopolysaccharide/colanic/teichoic acid biosynthesis glycosyltransferase
MRRLVDVVGASLAGVVLSPVIAVVGAVIRATLGRPVLFRQRRVGLEGREFDIVKFRTMRPEAWPGEPDTDRDTRVGRLVRGTSMDELPQLWNVLRGDMSIIGPRPTLPEQVRHYSPRQHGRHAVRPGLTGWAQVNGRNSIPWPDRIELDLWYIENRSLLLDLRILALTALKLVRPTGIYGEGGVNQGFPLPDRSAAE